MDAASTPDRKRVFHSSVTEYNAAKMSPKEKDRTGGVRAIELSNWKEDNDGCYIIADIAGTMFPCNQKSPLLGPNGLKHYDTTSLLRHETGGGSDTFSGA
eukprot:3994795-Prymnesium_polylepis.1